MKNNDKLSRSEKWWAEISPEPYQIAFTKGAFAGLVVMVINILALCFDWEFTQAMWGIIGPILLISLWHTFISVCVQRDKLRGKIKGDWDEFHNKT